MKYYLILSHIPVWKFMCVRNLLADSSWKWRVNKWLNKYKDTSVYLLFSATSIWFSRSPLSVVSACSIFQLKFSISASNWACWYSNCNGMISDVTTVHNPLLFIVIVSPNVSWGTAPCSKHMDMCIAGCIYKQTDLRCTLIITTQGYSVLIISYPHIDYWPTCT